jgi:hypothetical protein
VEALIIKLTPVLPPPTSPKFSAKEEKQCIKLGAIKDREGKRKLPDGREMITKPIMREIMTLLHKGSHWRPQAMCNVCLCIYTVGKQVCESFKGLDIDWKYHTPWHPPSSGKVE